jgi:phosphoribosyl 1,2-cyclic phosphate phosphodiesterase
MKITFLGTGSAHSYPLTFCRCDNCEQARAIGGPSLRKRSSILINHDLIIDLGPDIMTSSFVRHCSISDVRYCLQTHPHSDHLSVAHLFTRHPDYAPINVPPLHFYASGATLQKAAEMSKDEFADANLLDAAYCRQLNLEIREVEVFQPFKVGAYQVTAFPANHDASVDPLLYAIGNGGQTIFYGTDTATLTEETWRGFHLQELRFDVVILDHTYGPGFSRNDHLDALQFVQHIARMRKERLLTENARIFATHISHEGNPVHPELSNYATQHGYEIAYDGLIINSQNSD